MSISISNVTAEISAGLTPSVFPWSVEKLNGIQYEPSRVKKHNKICKYIQRSDWIITFGYRFFFCGSLMLQTIITSEKEKRCNFIYIEPSPNIFVLSSPSGPRPQALSVRDCISRVQVTLSDCSVHITFKVAC